MVFVKKRNRQFKNLREKRKILLKKGLSLLPNLFTLGNAFFGFCSIIFTAKGDLFAASYFILLGALMDVLDGRIARMIGASSLIGLQLDSFADSISFCLAPAFLYYFWQLKYLGFLGLLASAIFFLCGILRLARFNIIASQQTIFFLGLPTTVAGCFLVAIFLNISELTDDKSIIAFFVLVISLILSFLMVSRIRFPAFKKKIFNLDKNWIKVISVIFFAVIAILQFQKILLLLFILYFISAIILAVKFKNL